MKSRSKANISKETFMDRDRTVFRSPEKHGAKFDLMSLGIELDDDLIQRLQTNLGIEKIFSVAQKSAEIIKHKSDGREAAQVMAYRNVTESTNKPTDPIIKPFQKEIAKDSKFSLSILKELNDSQSKIPVEAKYKPGLDKMIENFKILYTRSPERFVCTLLGKKVKPNGSQVGGAGGQPGSDMSQMILKNRFVGEEEFAQMIRRIDANIDLPLIQALYRVLLADKNASTTDRRNSIDLWEFLTLLKTASDESRRSYDCKTSRLANDVEFWRRSNFNMDMPGTDGSVNTNEKFEVERAKRLNGIVDNTKRVFNPAEYPHTETLMKAAPNSKNGHVLSVAELLGNNTARAAPGPSQTKGRLNKDQNKCDVAMALTGVPSAARPSPKLTFTNITRYELDRNQFDDVFGNSQVSTLIHSADDSSLAARNSSGGDAEAARRSQSAARVRPRSANYIAKETLHNQTSVADAMGTDERPKTPFRHRNFSRSFMEGEALIYEKPHSGARAASVAFALGCDRDDVKGRSCDAQSNHNISHHFAESPSKDRYRSTRLW